MAKVQKSTDSSSLAEVVDRILDKGIVVFEWVTTPMSAPSSTAPMPCLSSLEDMELIP